MTGENTVVELPLESLTITSKKSTTSSSSRPGKKGTARCSPRKKTKMTAEHLATLSEKLVPSCPSPRFLQTKLNFGSSAAESSSWSSTDSPSPDSAALSLHDTDEDTVPMWQKDSAEPSAESLPVPPDNTKTNTEVNGSATATAANVSVKQEAETEVEVAVKEGKKNTRKTDKSSAGKRDRKEEVKQMTLTSSGGLSPVQPTVKAKKAGNSEGGRVEGKGSGRGDATVHSKPTVDATSRLSNASIDAYFPVLRRSERTYAKEIKKHSEENLDNAILTRQEDGLRVFQTEDRGRGVVATRPFHKDQFVVEYAGDKIDDAIARRREANYQKDSEIGCYMYYFMHGGKKWCIDATAESGRLGRLLNHSRSKPNCYTKVLTIAGAPYLVIFAKRDIDMGEELVYDYGERDKETLAHHPWLKS